MRFPELFRAPGRGGRRVVRGAGGVHRAHRRAHWETLLRARAIENLCYVVAPAQWGAHANGRETYGHSLIVDYWGQVLARLPAGEGVRRRDIDLARQARVRAAVSGA